MDPSANMAVEMATPDLARVPKVAPPTGWTLRGYRPGDDDLWFAIVSEAETWLDLGGDLFAREFGAHREELPQRMLFLSTPDGDEVGTATAWFAREDRSLGRIHWVAIRPRWQGRGLGLALLSAACQQLLELGHTAAYLATQTGRVPALNLYLKCGFRPRLRDADDAYVWAAVRDRLKYPSAPGPEA